LTCWLYCSILAEPAECVRMLVRPSSSVLNGFIRSGPARRFVADARRTHPKAVQVIPGGESGNPAGQWFGNQLGLWLTDDYHEATTRRGDIDVALRLRFVPAG
jgi:acyl-homoserine lactone acylase PvdQ